MNIRQENALHRLGLLGYPVQYRQMGTNDTALVTVARKLGPGHLALTITTDGQWRDSHVPNHSRQVKDTH